MVQGGGLTADMRTNLQVLTNTNEANNGLSNDRGTLLWQELMILIHYSQFFIHKDNDFKSFIRNHGCMYLQL